MNNAVVRVVAVRLSLLGDNIHEDSRLLSLLDVISVDKIKRFYKKDDAIRCLIGRLLPRFILSSPQFGIPVTSQQFSSSEHGRPYLASPKLDFDYNISHDSNFVVMAYTSLPCSTVGVDVMRVSLPSNEDLSSFLEAMWDQLSAEEQRKMQGLPEEDKLAYLMALWTHKEALTKSLGLGLGFDFSRLSFDIDLTRLCVTDLDVVPDASESELFRFRSWKVDDHFLTVCLKDDERQGGLTLGEKDIELRVLKAEEFLRLLLEGGADANNKA
ncbi:4'-phosphopantetheinyl transferase [Atractiella rhizophila]|nr:4'-phosphopantetheinyl transferase [Atractiella rhizophila]